jgi:glycine C-acetyltransferase/8-amino-7-oxononanoate synthase
VSVSQQAWAHEGGELEVRLAELERAGLRRRLRLISGPQGPRVLLDGRPVLLLCSNNYLGLADHPRVREAAADAAMRWGVGAGASRLVCGSMTIHRRLEERLAAFKRSEACVLFGSGYLANLGTIGALAGPGDVIFSDELNHASIIDGCRLSGAEVTVYRHCDVDHLEWCMRAGRAQGRSLVVTESVFSMDADIAPLGEMVELSRSYDARLIVDEAHATGALGPGGRGAVAEAGLEGEVDVLIGTLGKALGSYGAYVCSDAATVDYLINAARPLIFSTAPAPPAVAGALAALELIESRPHRVDRLRLAARALRGALADEGFAVRSSEMHIIPLVVGADRAAAELSRLAIERGVFAQAIRPPSVPVGSARLRLTVMASHTARELRAAARALARAAEGLGLDPQAIGEATGAMEPTAGPPQEADLVAREESTGELHLVEWVSEPAHGGGAELPETASFDVEQAWASEEMASGEEAFEAISEQRAPFDLEREGGLRDVA